MTVSAPRTALAAASAVGAVGVGAVVWGTCIERFLFTVRRHDLAVLPAGSPSLTVLHLSDAHMAPWQHRKQAWIARLAEHVQPDLVINTGDNLGHEDGLRGIRTAFAPLRGVPGLFVHGSNDVIGPSGRNPLRYFQGPSQRNDRGVDLDTAAMDAFFTDELGWNDLDNTAATMTVAGLRVDAFGVDDAHRDWDELDALPAAIAQMRRRPLLRPAATAALTLGVTHAPYRRVLDRFVDLGADVLLAGHTHGGQVRIPFSPSALVANCDIPLDQARGMSTWTHDGRTVPLNVSAGLGHSIYAPVRFGCRPEASVLTLRAVN
ncbi:MAG: metallophosphatase [Microbacterium sp. SCN 70-200]|uniref:metallophosphoesterase n=1 Tax=unclassified Microbacterium TaxID=2609290 RepID=UPI000869BFC0|nr:MULTISPECIES: metallophosphoesterase [unclassified Microbacterium]MBN9213614.1 metallophosphoesterase [Microbacterium sp.]ODT42239.1 MAG: metallophosphatase [Microbacterium sp. SCN 70-200]OJV79132.1 MAG: metallophosphatase [Microbacterium sp. 70-16]